MPLKLYMDQHVPRAITTNAVAIGANGGGDLLVLLPMKDSPDVLQHSVYWWDHETGEVLLLADDFGDLEKS